MDNTPPPSISTWSLVYQSGPCWILLKKVYEFKMWSIIWCWQRADECYSNLFMQDKSCSSWHRRKPLDNTAASWTNSTKKQCHLHRFVFFHALFAYVSSGRSQLDWVYPEVAHTRASKSALHGHWDLKLDSCLDNPVWIEFLWMPSEKPANEATNWNHQPPLTHQHRKTQPLVFCVLAQKGSAMETGFALQKSGVNWQSKSKLKTLHTICSHVIWHFSRQHSPNHLNYVEICTDQRCNEVKCFLRLWFRITTAL